MEEVVVSRTARYLKECRVKSGISQSQMSKIIYGTENPQNISNIERGKVPVPLKHLKKFIQTLDVNKIKLECEMVMDYSNKLNKFIGDV